MSRKQQSKQTPSRREFLKTSAATAATATVATALGDIPAVHASSGEVIRVGLVGAGGRGTGAATQCLNAHPSTKLWAVADAFEEPSGGGRRQALTQRINNLRQRFGERVEVANDRRFVGLDAYRQVIANCDLVILATPPGFRPLHIQAVIQAGKHLFTEKPVAVDGPGIRTVLAMEQEAERRNLCVVAGLQRHYQTGYLQSMEKIHGGQLGTITSGRCYWNQGSLWHTARTPAMSDLEWQIRNWLYFTWLSGDHICEQHVHNLDVINWAMQSHPVRCTGMGGRQSRTGPEFGHIYDHFTIEYEYPNDVHVLSMCRQIERAANNVSEAVTGTKGTWTSPNPGDQNNYRIRGENAWNFNRQGDNEPYQREHEVLLSCIREGRKINNLRYVAESTLTAIMGRMSAYTGQVVTWDQALNSTESLMPANLAWDMTLPVPPVAPGRRS
jgi:myo-inositol 2-dehydrogenase / D-chiro-inositol 1-dehydrogenase